MSYSAEWAEKPLTGEASDLLILQEREQRYLIGVNGHSDRMIIPTKHFLELRDMYKSLIDERNGEPGEPGKMSIEQAIAILNPKTGPEVLETYRYYGGFRGDKAEAIAYSEARWVAVAAMREKLSAERSAEKEESEQ